MTDEKKHNHTQSAKASFLRRLGGAFLFFIFTCGFIHANPHNFAVSEIPDSLKINANAVVRFMNIDFEYRSERRAVENRSYAITVLNRNGLSMGDFLVFGDQFRELRSFSARLYDANGRFLRRFRMSDVRRTEISSGLADDIVRYFFNLETPSFPITIHYEYEINWRNSVFNFPSFVPQFSFSLAVQQATYRLNIPADLRIRTRALNAMPELPETMQNRGRIVHTWQMENLKAIEQENFAPMLRDLIPILFVLPESFVFDGVRGTITDWESFGKWIYSLAEGRNALPQDFQNRIIEMTKDAPDDRERVRILYDFLGETTRYVSIQLGIGGYQPRSASDVLRTGFGDCKALAFFLQSMLDVIGIPSNYIVIRSDRRNRRILHDFPSFFEANHAILQVPLENDTLWLEATNPNIPFGFVHNSIAGADAIEITATGGRFVRLPDYPDSLNVEKNIANVSLNSDGSAEITSIKELHVKRYGDNFGFNLLRTSEQTDRLRRGINLPNATVNSVRVTEDKSPLPSFRIEYDWQTPLYGTRTGNRLFLPVNPFRRQITWFARTERTHDIHIWEGFKDIDSIFISIPDDFEIESLPAPVYLSTAYGNFSSLIVPQDDGIMIKQSFYFPRGKYCVSEYAEIRAFIEQINTAYTARIILRRK